MTTRDFISQVVSGKITREKRVSSVFYNGTDAIYSYGYHYPLLVKTKIGWICNDAGYSNTTAKHISYCRQYATGNVAYTRYSTRVMDIKNILGAINEELKDLKYKMEKLSVKAWRQYANMQERQNELRVLQAKIRSYNI